MNPIILVYTAWILFNAWSYRSSIRREAICLVGTPKMSPFVCNENSPIHEISKIIEEFWVNLRDKIVPRETRVLRFRSHVSQIKPPHVCRYSCVLSVVPEHTQTSRLGKFAILIIQILWKEKIQRRVRWGDARSNTFCLMKLSYL